MCLAHRTWPKYLRKASVDLVHGDLSPHAVADKVSDKVSDKGERPAPVAWRATPRAAGLPAVTRTEAESVGWPASRSPGGRRLERNQLRSGRTVVHNRRGIC